MIVLVRVQSEADAPEVALEFFGAGPSHHVGDENFLWRCQELVRQQDFLAGEPSVLLLSSHVRVAQLFSAGVGSFLASPFLFLDGRLNDHHLAPICLKKLILTVGQFTPSPLLLLGSFASVLLALSGLALLTSVVVDSVLLLEFVLADG